MREKRPLFCLLVIAVFLIRLNWIEVEKALDISSLSLLFQKREGKLFFISL